MKISKREQKLLLYVLGVMILIIVYLTIFSNVQEKNASLESERTILQSKVSQLETWEANKETYQKETASMEKELETLYAGFPVDIKEESVIMYSRELETLAGLQVSAVSILGQNLLYTSGSGEGQKYLYGTNVTLDYTGSYGAIKTVVEHIQEDEKRKNVESISLSYDSATSNLLASMTVNCYSIAGTDQKYTKPVIPTMPIGSDNIFGQ